MQLAVNATMDKFWISLPPLAALPVSAAVPLQSTINCYGPWGARIGDNANLDFSTCPFAVMQRLRQTAINIVIDKFELTQLTLTGND